MKLLFETANSFRGNTSPEKFKRLYLLLAFSCLTLILLLSWFVIAHHTRENLITGIEADSHKIASALLLSEKNTIRFRAENNQSDLVIPSSDIPDFDKRIRAFLHPLHIVKIKIYDAHMRIIYCTEQALIGRTDSSNQRLKNSLNGTIQTVMKDRQSITDLEAEKRYEADVAEVYVPIRGESGKIYGVFEVYSDISEIKNDFKQQLTSSLGLLFFSLLFLSAISYCVIIRISSTLSNAYNLLETVATTDSLTGIFNRRQMLIRAEELYAMMQRSHDKLSDGVGLGVVMIDIDHFKNVNDTYGHLVGDDVLRILTKQVESVLRPYDVFGRYGGEEFLVFLPTTRFEEAEQIANRILSEVSGQPFQLGKSSICITVSIGCSWTDAQEENLDKVLSRVDSLMYKAKHQGRNQVVSG